MLSADLILVDYRLVINVAVWHFINIIRLFSVQTSVFQFETCFWSKRRKKRKKGKDDFQRKKNFSWFRKMTLRNLYPLDYDNQSYGRRQIIRSYLSKVSLFHGNWISIAKSRRVHNCNILILPEIEHPKRFCCAQLLMSCLNLLKPTGHVMHQQFNIRLLYVLPTLYLCVLYLSENKQRLVPLVS